MEVEEDHDLAKVSLIGAGMRSHPGIAAKMFRTLADHGINLRMISTSPIKISCMIPKSEMATAVRALHEAFELDRAPRRRRPSVPRVAILGATGAVGDVLRRVLAEREFPVDELVCLASPRSAGKRVALRRRRGRGAGRLGPRPSRASTSRCSAPARRARASGRRSPSSAASSWSTTRRPSAWIPSVPLVVADVNPRGRARPPRPGREPQLLDHAADAGAEADPRHRSASSASPSRPTSRSPAPARRPSTACAAEAVAVARRRRAVRARRLPAPHRLQRDAAAGSFAGDDGYTDEELKLVNETRKILSAARPARVASPACACRS